MAFGPRPSALLRVLVFGKEMTSFYSCKSRHWRTACSTLPLVEGKTSATELGAVLCLRIRLGTAAIHHASITPSEFKGKVAKYLLFLRVFWRFIYCHLPGQWEMFTCLLCQLSSGSSNMITTLECSEMLSGSSYLLIWSPGHLTTVKKKPPPKHHPAPNHLKCGPRSSSSILLLPCYCSLQFLKWYLFFPQALPHLGSEAGLESGVLPGAGYTCKQASGRGRPASRHHRHHGSVHQSPSTGLEAERLRFKRSASRCSPPGEARTLNCRPTPHTQRLRAAAIASVRAVQTPLRPFSTRIKTGPPHFLLPGAVLWAPSGNYRRWPKVWLMFQRFEPIAGCPLSRTQHIIGGTGVQRLFSTDRLGAHSIFKRSLTPDNLVSCQSTWSPPALVKKQ